MKEQIIEVLKKHIGECAISGDDADYLLFHLTKDILSLPIDVPSEEEIEEWVNKDKKNLIDYEVWTMAELKERFIGRYEGTKYAINEIIKRNKTE